MKILAILAAGAFALGLSACSKEADCSPEALQKKALEVTQLVQQKISSDPSKMGELMTKIGDLAKKYQSTSGASQAEACKAYDELLQTIKG